jgi:uncharacterized protein YeaO (DUF488 family)
VTSLTTHIKLKSLKEPTEDSDGLRILIARYRPRYLPKCRENWKQWWKDLAPSRDLWKDYIKDKKIEWPEYSRRYINEIKNNPEAVQLLWILSFFVNDDKDRKQNHFQQVSKQEQEQGQQRMYDLIQKYDVVTLLCHCIDENHCHRSIVKKMISEFAESSMQIL